MSRNNLKDVCDYLKKRGNHDNVMDLCVGFREGVRRMEKMSQADVVAKHRTSCASVGRTAKKQQKKLLRIKQKSERSKCCCCFVFFLPHRHAEGTK